MHIFIQDEHVAENFPEKRKDFEAKETVHVANGNGRKQSTGLNLSSVIMQATLSIQLVDVSFRSKRVSVCALCLDVFNKILHVLRVTSQACDHRENGAHVSGKTCDSPVVLLPMLYLCHPKNP